MPITGAWKDAQRVESGALKWGTGINPIHAIRTGDGRETTPSTQENIISEELVDPVQAPEMGYTDEDNSSTLYGYGFQTGTETRPQLGTEDTRNDNPTGYPPWGQYKPGVPGGTAIRADNIGADITNSYKVHPSETVNEGWLNKPKNGVEDAVTSDVSQYEMQTSMTQRDKVRAGSQAAAGRANEFDAPIASRITGQKLRFFSGGERHYDMLPKAQDLIIRPFWYRNAGTGYVDWMDPNEMYVSEPYNRMAPSDPNVGPDTPPNETYNYTDEEMNYYA